MTEEEQYYKATRDNLLAVISTISSDTGAAKDLNGLKVERVLDVGCGIGQALFHLAVPFKAFGVGVDISAMGLKLGKEFYAEHLPEADLTFIRSAAEILPFESESFDLINCGLALPYTHNARAIAEISRVLKPGGVLLLKIHHAWFYISELWHGLTKADLPSIVHSTRVLAAGSLYHIFRRQPQMRFLNETFQTQWLLRSELIKHGLVIEREQNNTNQLTPAFVIQKTVDLQRHP